MQDLPPPVTGNELFNLRRSYGVQQKDLADAIGIHRTRLHEWESAPQVDPIRAARYRAGLAAVVKSKIGAVA